MLWNFKSQQLLQGGLPLEMPAVCMIVRICEGRWNAAWCTGCFTRNVYSPRTYFAKYESWFYYALYTSVLIDTYSFQISYRSLCVWSQQRQDHQYLIVPWSHGKLRLVPRHLLLSDFEAGRRGLPYLSNGIAWDSKWPPKQSWFLRMKLGTSESKWYEV